MQHIIFGQSENYPVAILIKPTGFRKFPIEENYVKPLEAFGVSPDSIVAFDLQYDQPNKVSAKTVKTYLDELLPAMDSIGVKYVYVADAAYFKALTRQTKTEPHIGYILDCAVKGFEHLKIVLGINHQQLIYKPELKEKLFRTLQVIPSHMQGSLVLPGQGIIHSSQYPKLYSEIKDFLDSLHQYPILYADIEAFSLDFRSANIGTISFAWDKHNGGAFAVDYRQNTYTIAGISMPFGHAQKNFTVRKLLYEFFTQYKGKIVWHNICYDAKVLIYELFMGSLEDTQGLLHGLHVFTKSFDDTKIIAYLATNSTAGNSLSLKDLAQEFAGNWANSEIHDITLIPLDELLQYNLVDSLSTAYVYEKYLPIMISDNQQKIYDEIMLPSLKTIIQMELTGMPIVNSELQKLSANLKKQSLDAINQINSLPVIKTLNFLLQQEKLADINSKLKTKQHDMSKVADLSFNPASNKQLQTLLYVQMGLPVIDKTDTGAPATGAETITKLMAHTTNQDYIEVLKLIIDFNKAEKILNTFIPAFETATKMDTDNSLLFGSFNLGGTVSGRLSSSNPNLQNLPSGSTYGKQVKQIFAAPAGWIFCGADFNSLEDYISALTTKDPNKLAVYEQGFCGHCLRAAYYFRDQLLHIDVTDPVSVNSIKKTHPTLRQDSKGPTFALTYQGTWITLVNNLGFTPEKAKAIEANYHELYKVSDQYVQEKLTEASKTGYVEVAFGLRVRTPLLKQVLYGSNKIPYEAAAEGRTAGNALGQSYGMLNNRAANEFMQRVHASPYALDVKPVALIHDAIYLVIRDDIDVIKWVNDNLIECMQWQELPEIQHPTVKLGAALDLYYPSWAHPITLPNGADKNQIYETVKKSMDEYNSKKEK